MPYQDGTGPRGLGPRTGRGRGCCSAVAKNTTKEEEKAILKKQKKTIEARLKELE